MIGLPDKHDLTEFTHLGKHRPTEVSQYAHTLTNFHIQNLWNAPTNILLPTCLFVQCYFSCSILSLSYRLIQFLDNSIKNVTWGCTLGNDGISERTANIFKYTITFHFQNVGGTQVTSPVSSSTHRIAKVKTCPFSCKEHNEKFFSCKEQVEEVAFSCPAYQLQEDFIPVVARGG